MRLGGGDPTVDDELRTRHEARGIRGQEDGRSGKVLGGAPAPQGRSLQEVVGRPFIGCHSLGHLRLDPAGGQDVHTDPVTPQPACQGPSVAQDCALGRRVVGSQREGEASNHAPGDDDGAASVHYPIRGAATFKSTVGLNVASDALANLSSGGVTGGAIVITGEDYGEGSSIMQERSYAFAMKSQMWLLDPRPDLPHIVDLVEQAFDLSEVSNTPVMMEFRIRACHMHGRFATRDNRKPLISRHDALSDPDFDFSRICLPPSTYAQEKHRVEHRMPAALTFIKDKKLNEFHAGSIDESGDVPGAGADQVLCRR